MIPLIGKLFKPTSQTEPKDLQRRFIMRVLAPPFVVLFILGVIVFWQLDSFVRNQAVNELKRAATATASKLDREFALRQTVLKRTGEDLFTIKSTYQTNRQKLDQNRTDCETYIKQKKTFSGSASCEPFLAEFASKGSTQKAVEDGYAKLGAQLITDQNKQISDRLGAFKQFFPETAALLVVDNNQKVVSSAFSDNVKGSTESFVTDANSARSQSIEGRLASIGDLRLAEFAFPITGGSVLAAYNLDSSSFLLQSWESTPIDRNKAVTVILDSGGQPAYPDLKVAGSFKDVSSKLRTSAYASLDLKHINNIAVGAEAGSSKWLVIVASPASAVLAPVRDAQLAGVVVIGLLLLAFLWVGAYFIQRTVRSILGLVSGALVFASGKLDYKIQLAGADAEFTKLAETMNNMAARIATAEKELDEKNKEFISVATHELRAPLTAIIGNLSIVDEESSQLNPELKDLFKQAYSSTIRLKELVNDMLDVARLEGGRTEFDIKPQNIGAAINGVLETLQITAKEKNITLAGSNISAGQVLADEGRLRIVLNNFVSNAIKYNRPNGTVTVSNSVKDNQLITAVSDTGLGIPEDQKAHIFEKFFRVKNDDRKNIVGTGLGMYITRQYIVAMGGQVWFDSIHGQGTTFYFSLPIAQQAVAPATTPVSLNQSVGVVQAPNPNPTA